MATLRILLTASFVIVVSAIFAACGGGDKPSAPAEGAATTAKPVNGEEVYKRTCVACHQPTGSGIPKTFPPLAGSDFLRNRENVISQVITGRTGELVVNGEKYNNTMPPQILSDEEIAAVLTYVYSNFGNTGSPVTADEVKAIRAKVNR